MEVASHPTVNPKAFISADMSREEWEEWSAYWRVQNVRPVQFMNYLRYLLELDPLPLTPPRRRLS